MEPRELKQKIRQLLVLLQKERELAKSLDLEGLAEATAAKGALLASLEPLQSAEKDAELRSLVQEVREENRRNAFLYWSALGWVREMMGFFGQRSVPVGYGAGGGEVTSRHGGRLLSGRV